MILPLLKFCIKWENVGHKFEQYITIWLFHHYMWFTNIVLECKGTTNTQEAQPILNYAYVKTLLNRLSNCVTFTWKDLEVFTDRQTAWMKRNGLYRNPSHFEIYKKKSQLTKPFWFLGLYILQTIGIYSQRNILLFFFRGTRNVTLRCCSNL